MVFFCFLQQLPHIGPSQHQNPDVGRFRNYREIRTPSRKTDANFDFVFVKTDFFTMTHGAMFKVGAKNLFVFTLLVKNISVVYSAARCNS